MFQNTGKLIQRIGSTSDSRSEKPNQIEISKNRKMLPLPGQKGQRKEMVTIAQKLRPLGGSQNCR